MIVELRPGEIAQAYCVAGLRQASAVSHGRNGTHGLVDDGLENCERLHGVGCLAELAVCKASDRFWSGALGGIHLKADIGSNWQVRSTAKTEGRRSLIIHRSDPDDHYFFLVFVLPDAIADIRGWILAADGKREEWWTTDTGRPAFFIPPDALNPGFPDDRPT